MNSAAASFEPLRVLIMLAALAAAIVLGRQRRAAWPITPLERWGILAGALIGAVVLAKLPFVIADARALWSTDVLPLEGKTIVFGLVGGYLGVEFAKRLMGVTHKTGDAFVVPLAIAVAIGRLGCYRGGCCAGQPSDAPWAVDFGDGILRHPTQLYDSLFHALAAGVCLILEERKLLVGQRLKAYFLAYFAFRFAIETVREEPLGLWGLSIYQWSCIALTPIFVTLWIVDARAARAARGTP